MDVHELLSLIYSNHRKAKGTEMTNSIKLDIIDVELAKADAARHNLTMSVVDADGPGQCAIVEFVGQIDDLKSMIAEYAEGAEAPEFYHAMIE